MTTRYTAYAPDGARIIGTLETIQACARTELYTLENGIFQPDEEQDTETQVYWDSRVTEVRGDQRVFLDQLSREWLESEVTFMPENPQPEPEPPLSADQLRSRYAMEGEHPVHTINNWQSLVADHCTILGYWDWVAFRLQNPSEDSPEN